MSLGHKCPCAALLLVCALATCCLLPTQARTLQHHEPPKKVIPKPLVTGINFTWVNKESGSFAACGAGNVFSKLPTCAGWRRDGWYTPESDLANKTASDMKEDGRVSSEGGCDAFIECNVETAVQGKRGWYGVNMGVLVGTFKETNQKGYYASAMLSGRANQGAEPGNQTSTAAGVGPVGRGTVCGCMCEIVRQTSSLANRPECKCYSGPSPAWDF